MAKTKVVLHNAAFAELRTLPAVQADVRRRADEVAAAAGAGYSAFTNRERKTRAGATVMPTTADAIRSEARDHKLLSALDAGRG